MAAKPPVEIPRGPRSLRRAARAAVGRGWPITPGTYIDATSRGGEVAPKDDSVNDGTTQ